MGKKLGAGHIARMKRTTTTIQHLDSSRISFGCFASVASLRSIASVINVVMSIMFLSFDSFVRMTVSFNFFFIILCASFLFIEGIKQNRVYSIIVAGLCKRA